MIKIATAECFTHGKIGMAIHSYSRGYLPEYNLNLDPEIYKLSLVAGLFIPTLSGVRSILRFEPLKPMEIIGDIKVYDQEKDQFMALKMAESVKSICESNIGIGTTAGVGEGAIALVSDETKVVSSSGVYADLRISDPEIILRRQESGIIKALHLLEKFIKNEVSSGDDTIIFI